jgi:transcriptional regulator with XRE-family HTH domain
MTAPGQLIADARHAAGLSQDQLAARAGTSRPTLSSYEHGRRSPTLQTAARILAAAGFELTTAAVLTFTEQPIGRGRSVSVPSHLPRLDPADALATITLPRHLQWSGGSRRVDLRDRRQRARTYEIVLREGTAEDLLTYVDGVLLVDLWEDLVLPQGVRTAWSHLIHHPTATAAA